jgi:Leucine-rich repeat (LRR) protein
LTVLELRGNKFTEIPAVMGHLIGLTQITLSNNQLTQIPDSIRHLKRLARMCFKTLS